MIMSRSVGRAMVAIAWGWIASLPAFAECTDGRHFTPAAEIARSASVVVGRVADSRNESDPDDPIGIARTFYTVDVLEVLKGSAEHRIELVSENTSSRFPMDIGKTYLLYVRSVSGSTYIDSCGNSGLLSERGAAYDEVKKALHGGHRP